MWSSHATRRSFLKALGTTAAVSFNGVVPGLWTRSLAAATTAPADGRVLVLIQLAGGNDGLNTVVPFADDLYYKARPGIAIEKGAALPLNDRLALHPSLAGLRGLWDDGRLAIVEGVGYPEPDRSHFRSMDIWQSAQPAELSPQTGWLGRSFDLAHVAQLSVREGACIGGDRQALTMTGRTYGAPVISNLTEFRLHGSPPLPPFAMGADDDSELAFLRRSAASALQSAQRLERIAQSAAPGNGPSTELARRLRLVAQMIAAELPTSVYFVTLDGFDTHAQQSAGHAALLQELGDAVKAFTQELEGHGLSDRVMIATFSEFGRRVAENGSLGTDHGAASVLFAVTPSGGGFYGAPPSLSDLDDGDLRFTTNFRRVYATLLDRWLGLPSAAVLGDHFEPLDFAGPAWT